MPGLQPIVYKFALQRQGNEQPFLKLSYLQHPKFETTFPDFR